MKSIGESSYEQFADRYAQYVDTKPHNAYYERPATLSLLPDVRGLHVLDAGCGPGVYSALLLEQGASVVACDVTPRMLELARERLAGRAAVHHGDLTGPLAFAADAEFDLVICPLVLDYVPDWSVPFAEFFRVLKPGCMLVFSAGHPASDYFKLHPQGNYFQIEQLTMAWHGFGEPYPEVSFFRRSFSDMVNPLIAAGFIVEQVVEPRPTEDFRRANRDDYDELMRRPGFICIRARKPEHGRAGER